MGEQAASFTASDAAGLCFVLTGLVLYRFLGPKPKAEQLERPLFTMNFFEAALIGSTAIPAETVLQSRDESRIRLGFYSRLGVEIPAAAIPIRDGSGNLVASSLGSSFRSPISASHPIPTPANRPSGFPDNFM